MAHADRWFTGFVFHLRLSYSVLYTRPNHSFKKHVFVSYTSERCTNGQSYRQTAVSLNAPHSHFDGGRHDQHYNRKKGKSDFQQKYRSLARLREEQL